MGRSKPDPLLGFRATGPAAPGSSDRQLDRPTKFTRPKGADTERMTAPSWAERFTAAYPDAVPDGVAWFEENLRLSRRRMCQLAGVTGEARLARRSSPHRRPPEWQQLLVALRDGPLPAWRSLHTFYPTRVEELEGVLAEYLHSFGYDWPAAAAFFARPPRPAGFFSPHPGLTDDAWLLAAIHRRAPGWTEAVADYFAR